MTALPPLIPGSQSLSTLDVSKAKINTLLGDSLSTLNTWKSSVRAASTANIASLVGAMTVDGVALVAGDTILLKNQSTGTQNGLYVVKTLAWQRKSNMPVGISVAGAAVFVNEGTANSDRAFVCTNNPGSDVVGTNALVFTTLVANAIAQGTINQIQVSDGSGVAVASAATATVAGLLTGATGVVATTGGVTASAGNITATAGSIVGTGHVYSSKVDYTQITNATTAVAITTSAGSVTTVSLTNATTVAITFNLTGSVILSTSKLILTPVLYSGVAVTNGVPMVFATSVVAGTAGITVTNFGANALSGTLTFNYIIV